MKACYCGQDKIGYSEFGDPLEVLNFFNDDKDDPGPGEVVVRVIASPINQSDLLMIKGEYPEKSQFYPYVGGNDGVGKVIKIGEGVTQFKKGDLVVPLVEGLGWWRLRLKTKAELLYKVPNDISVIGASMLSSIYCLAYRMLKDFCEFTEHEVLIQNGANSSVGQIVIQLCKLWNVMSINVIRYRENMDELESYLTELGANYILTDVEMLDTCIFRCDSISRPKLGLNCVGDENGMNMMTLMDDNSKLLTYGEASGSPLLADLKSLVYRGINVSGFWMAAWHKNHLGSEEQRNMMDELVKLMQNGSIKTPVNELVPFTDYKDAIENMMDEEGKVGVKFILDVGSVEEYEPEEPKVEEPNPADKCGAGACAEKETDKSKPAPAPKSPAASNTSTGKATSRSSSGSRGNSVTSAQKSSKSQNRVSISTPNRSKIASSTTPKPRA